MQILALLLVAFGFSDSYQLLRWDVLIVTAVLAYYSFSSQRYYWGLLFVAFAFLFNPIDTPSLTKTQWIIADYVLVLALATWAWDYFHSYHKGHLFELYIQTRFPKNEWNVVDYTRDSHKRLRRFVETDGNPDFVFRKITIGYAVAVECKYRSKYWKHESFGEGIGWERKLTERYSAYSQKQKMPVYIAIGVGGNPKAPSVVSFIPLEVIQNRYPTFIPRELIEDEKYRNVPPV